MKVTKKQKKSFNKLNANLQIALANGTKNLYLLKYIISINDFDLLNAVALNENATADILDSLLSTEYLTVAANIVCNTNTSENTLKKLIPLNFLIENLNQCECNFEITIAEHCNHDYREIQNLLHTAIITHSNVTEELLVAIINETNSENILNIISKYNKKSDKLNELIENKKDWLHELQDRACKLNNAVELLQTHKYEAAYNLILPEAKNGNPNAQYLLACMYGNGSFVEEDQDKVLYWFKKSADAGFELAMVSYAMELLEINGFDHYHEAIYYIENAANNGYDEAINLLDSLGQGVNHAV
ncbi:MAG: sel1 repeat family protein [Sulfurimonas sp.]|nr:sel1 repeat family protein [Sulfurimonas sp.]